MLSLHEKTISEEEEMLGGLLHADPAAANRLIDRFGQPLVRYFQVHLPDPSLAEDMAQEVFLRLLRMVRRGQFHEIRSLYSLVFTIARNLAIDLRKAAGRAPRWESLDEEPSQDLYCSGGPVLVQLRSNAPDPREQAASSQQMERLQAALRNLPPDFRDIVVLRHMEGLNGRQIAEILNVPEGTVWSRLSRALEELRAQLRDTLDVTPELWPRKGGER